MTRARDLAAFVSNADGDIKFDTDTLFIDSSANRVGIGTTTPSAPLDVELGTTGTIAEFRGDSTDLLNIDGDSNAITLDARNVASLNFEMQGTEAMRIDSSGQVGIGGLPSYPLHVIGTDSNHQVRIEKTSATTGNLNLGVDSSGSFIESQSNIPLRFFNGGSERMRILSGGGLTFNGDTAAANALDDYETGTWTPTLVNGGTAGNNYASYVKIGDLVTAYAYISAASIPNNSNQFQIGGLPFNSHSNSNYYAGGSLSYSGDFNTNVFTDPLVVFGGTYLYFHRNDGNSASINNNNLYGATRYLIFQVTYHTSI